MPTLVIATRNAHKVEEIQAVLGSPFRCLSLREFPDPPVVEETGDTFAANARLKSEAIARWLVETPPEKSPLSNAADTWVLADDSGLEVDALNGAPGVHSARFAAADPASAGNSPDHANNAKLLRLLEGVPIERRTARFRCTLALTPLGANPGSTLIFEGACEGRIGFAPRGAHGFGYDPLFTPDGQERTFAELGEATKNRLSHRARALARLAAGWGRI